MSPSKTNHIVIYRSSLGEEIRVLVPWPLHSGVIPPPEIIFRSNGHAMTFIYQESE